MGGSAQGDRALGLRAGAKHVFWAIVEGTRAHPVVVAREDLTSPVTYGEPEALSWLRDKVHAIIFAHSPTIAAIRTPETTARGRTEGDRRRLRIEGVLMEAAHAKGLPVQHGTLATIAARLGMKSAKEAKQYRNNGGDLRGLNLSELSEPLRECVLIAAAMLPNGAD